MKVELVGVISDKSAIGARMNVVTGDDRSIHRTVTAGCGFANTGSPVVHIGLGPANRNKVFRILWPSGVEQMYLDLKTRSTH
ncbi:MAG: ASPIC/UnbV domain-containing protein [Planctomycetota bacterium]